MLEPALITAAGAVLIFTPLVLILYETGFGSRLGGRVGRREPRRPDDPTRLEQAIVKQLYGGSDPNVRVKAAPRRSVSRSLRIAMLAPPWIPIPPPGYGGIEAVLDLLCSALVRRGHEVVLFAAPGSRSDATVISPLEVPLPDQIGKAVHEADHVARALELIEAGVPGGRPYDLIHDHSGFTAVAVADRLRVPVVHTLHGPLDEERIHAFYARHGRKVTAVAISEAQARRGPDTLPIEAVVPNPIDVASWPFAAAKDDYLLWIGRMTPGKGAHRAIEAARGAGAPLVLAGPVQPGQEEFFRQEVEPRLDSPGVDYIGEVGGRQKQELFARARALLMPIRWPEPFGMVMVEALAAGTPVVVFPEGAAPEIVEHGVTGFHVANEAEMAAAVAHLHEIEPRRCREEVARRYDPDRVAAAYQRVYRRVASGTARHAAKPRASARSAVKVASTEQQSELVSREDANANS